MITPIDPASPFEVFRTPIIIRRFTQGFYFNGIWQEGSQVILSAVVSSGNQISMMLNGVALAPVVFNISVAQTMAILQAEILSQPNIEEVDISPDFLTITIVPTVPNLSVVNVFNITGGASQPIITIANSPLLINATASVQPTKGKEVMLVPEGRRDQETYKMYTSTQIFGVDTQNPDQIQILKAPYFPTVFEVIKIDEWQNNPNFNIVNHYKYICMKLQPLPGVL